MDNKKAFCLGRRNGKTIMKSHYFEYLMKKDLKEMEEEYCLLIIKKKDLNVLSDKIASNHVILTEDLVKFLDQNWNCFTESFEYNFAMEIRRIKNEMEKK